MNTTRTGPAPAVAAGMKLLYLLALPLLIAAWGCGTIKIPVPHYDVAPPDPSTAFLAGVARVDITPPPGFPLGGHSIGGRMARGYWTRLYARAFYFQDAGGRRLILVSCDLFAIPAGLFAQVAEELQLPPESLIISATHTHHGPAGYMSSAVFNFGGLLPGYNFELAKWLKEGIEEAINSARTSAFQSRAKNFGIVLRTGFAPNLQRNRAIDAFYLNDVNETAAVLRASKAAGMTCPGGGGECPRYQAADPTLRVLEVLRGGERIGLLVFYAIHNTAMSHDCTLYQSDLSGYAMHLLEEAKPDNPVVAGFFNGAEGDISPRWTYQDRGDVVRLGGQLADAVKVLLNKTEDTQPNPVISAAREEFTAVPPTGPTRELILPGSGVGELGGAEDGRTVMYAYGWHGGVTGGGADPKVPALSLHNLALLKILQPIIGAPKNYPRTIPVSIASLGTLSLAAIPTEMTTVQGLHIRQALQNVKGGQYTVVGLANEYIGYTTTEAEYKAQNYEGASTMYGKKQGKVIGDLLVRVAKSNDPPSLSVKEAKFDAGAKWPYHFGPQLFGERYNLPYEDLEPVMPDAGHRPDDSAPRFEWKEPKETDWDTRRRVVRILRQDPDGWKLADGDRGVNILTVLVDSKSDSSQRLWTAIWAPSTREHLDRAAHHVFWVEKFWVEPKSAVCSEAFQLGGPVTTVPMAPLKTVACPSWSGK